MPERSGLLIGLQKSESCPADVVIHIRTVKGTHEPIGQRGDRS